MTRYDKGLLKSGCLQYVISCIWTKLSLIKGFGCTLSYYNVLKLEQYQISWSGNKAFISSERTKESFQVYDARLKVLEV
jgi:hypothetical protein